MLASCKLRAATGKLQFENLALSFSWFHSPIHFRIVGSRWDEVMN